MPTTRAATSSHEHPFTNAGLSQNATSDSVLPRDSVSEIYRLQRKERLFTLRDGRPHPVQDGKILATWNRLIVAAFCPVRSTLWTGHDTLVRPRTAHGLLAII